MLFVLVNVVRSKQYLLHHEVSHLLEHARVKVSAGVLALGLDAGAVLPQQLDDLVVDGDLNEGPFLDIHA